MEERLRGLGLPVWNVPAATDTSLLIKPSTQTRQAGTKAECSWTALGPHHLVDEQLLLELVYPSDDILKQAPCTPSCTHRPHRYTPHHALVAVRLRSNAPHHALFHMRLHAPPCARHEVPCTAMHPALHRHAPPLCRHRHVPHPVHPPPPHAHLHTSTYHTHPRAGADVCSTLPQRRECRITEWPSRVCGCVWEYNPHGPLGMLPPRVRQACVRRGRPSACLGISSSTGPRISPASPRCTL